MVQPGRVTVRVSGQELGVEQVTRIGPARIQVDQVSGQLRFPLQLLFLGGLMRRSAFGLEGLGSCSGVGNWVRVEGAGVERV
jgi:hypothetical protein